MLRLINVFGKGIPMYGICMLTAFVLCTFIAIKKTKKMDIPTDSIIVIMALVAGFAVILGKVVFIFVTYPLDSVLKSVLKLDFDFIKTSGIVFYGGLAGGILGAIIGSRVVKINIWSLEDVFVPLIPLGHSLGRVGCLLSGCCYGINYNGAFAVKYAYEGGVVSRFPVQPLEAILDIFIMLYLFHFIKKEHRRFDVTSMYLLLYAVMRFFTEMLRGDSVRGFAAGLSTSQWISLGIISCVVVYKVILRLKNNN